MFSISIPYYVDPKELPCRLPTKEEIESSKDILSEYQTTRTVVGAGPHFVVKYGISVDPIEGENMLFVQRNTSVPVPHLYAIYTDASDHTTYIVMERINGYSLDFLWPQMSEAEKLAVSEKLRASMDQLRILPAPGGRYGSLSNRGLLDVVFWTGNSTNTLAIEGPFDTEDEINSAMIKKYHFNCSRFEKGNFYERVFPRIFRNHPPVFTHGDFQKKNIVVRKSLSDEVQPLECREVVLIDWEFSGWYPSYWEHGKALHCCGGWNDDWHRYVANSLDEYLVEWAYLSTLLTELWS